MPGSTERDRHHEVMRLLEDAGRVSVPDLAERFGVSVVTVRNDLERLERLRLLRRVRGGAVLAPSPDEGSFEIRVQLHVAEKLAVAREAARMVRDGDAIAVDGSTTSTREPVINEAAMAANLTNEGGAYGTIRLLRNSTGMWLLQESRRQWAREGREHSYEELVRLAASRDTPIHSSSLILSSHERRPTSDQCCDERPPVQI